MIEAFNKSDEPEVIIVVDKLLTGFDAPRNMVLYLDKNLKEHGLLQAIARVNRLHEGKEFGFIIDYFGVLAKLDEALDLYTSLPEFEREDLALALTDISEETAKLPQRYSELWDVFEREERAERRRGVRADAGRRGIARAVLRQVFGLQPDDERGFFERQIHQRFARRETWSDTRKTWSSSKSFA